MSESTALSETQRLALLPPLLLDWYDRARRTLPWREFPTPYRVWISEIMLQQTRVDTVLPYFDRFLNALPDVPALAAVGDEPLMKLWEGLGYYSRARNLKKAAALLMERHGGVLPSDFALLRTLPGLGEYSAGAIASIAFGIRVPAVDGNVLRVLTRVLADAEELTPTVKRRLTEQTRAMLPDTRVGDFNQSLMELGALVCLPNGAPRCECCPLREDCLGRERGIADSLPIKTAKAARPVLEKTVFLLVDSTRLALRRRPKSGLLAAMWELPNVDGTLDEADTAAQAASWGLTVDSCERLPDARHIFTHLEWRMRVWRVHCAPDVTPSDRHWVDADALAQQYALPTAFGAIIRAANGVG